MITQTEFSISHGGPDPAYIADKDTGLTPTPVVRQGLEWLRDGYGLQPKTMLDPSAGYGVFGMVAREVWPEVESWGVEKHGDCLLDLTRNYIHPLGMPLEELGFYFGEGFIGPFDLIATNPPFSIVHEWIPKLRNLLTPDGVLCLLLPNGYGQRGEEKAEIFERDIPFRQLRISGPIEFKGPTQGADQRDYSWWMWNHANRSQSPEWNCTQLPRLPSSDRKWLTAPGAENA